MLHFYWHKIPQSLANIFQYRGRKKEIDWFVNIGKQEKWIPFA